MFPVSMGMNRFQRDPSVRFCRVPRECGDEPISKMFLISMVACSP